LKRVSNLTIEKKIRVSAWIFSIKCILNFSNTFLKYYLKLYFFGLIQLFFHHHDDNENCIKLCFWISFVPKQLFSAHWSSKFKWTQKSSYKLSSFKPGCKRRSTGVEKTDKKLICFILKNSESSNQYFHCSVHSNSKIRWLTTVYI
jgi:hypothetical protein